MKLKILILITLVGMLAFCSYISEVAMGPIEGAVAVSQLEDSTIGYIAANRFITGDNPLFAFLKYSLYAGISVTIYFTIKPLIKTKQ